MTSVVSRRPVAVVLAVIVLALACAGALSARAATSDGGTGPTAAPRSALANLSLRQLAGQRLVVGYSGTRVPADLRARVRRGELAGIILLGGNIASRSALRAEMRRLQAIPRPADLRAPLLVTIDQEGGLVKRLSGAPSRSPAEYGRTSGPATVRQAGRATALNLRDVGVNVNLAPVVDVGRAGSYQRRTGRSYSSSPARVGDLASAFVRGLQERGAAATLKHFPGLGRVRGNEDDTVQRIAVGRSTLRSSDELPFARGIAAGVDLVMTSTGVYPALDRAHPALLSRRIATGELRGHLGFRGVTITDDLDVVALRRYGAPGTLAVGAAVAGNDLLLFTQTSSVDDASTALVQALRSGTMTRREAEASVARTLALRARLAG